MQATLEEIFEKMDLKLKKGSVLQSTVFEDNNGCIAIAKAPKMSPRTKHIALKYHFFKSHLNDTNFVLQKIDTDVQTADIFTKGLVGEKFQILCKLLAGW